MVKRVRREGGERERERERESFYSTGSGFNPPRNKIIIQKKLSDQDERQKDTEADRQADRQTAGEEE